MATQINVPEFPESVEEGTLIAWAKADGQPVSADEKLADVETDKVILEVFAPASGTLSISKEEGSILQRGDVIGAIDSGGSETVKKEGGKTRAKKKAAKSKAAEKVAKTAAAPAPTPAVAAVDTPEENSVTFASPSVRKLVVEHGINPSDIAGSGKDGRILKADVASYLDETPELQTNIGDSLPQPAPRKAPAPPSAPSSLRPGERRVPMSQIRARIATRLVEVQQSAAILTTFNEVNMKPVMDIRAKYKDKFADIYGVKLGFMSFFVKAATEALKQFPEVNARVEGRDIIYNEHCHVGIAVDSPRGLVVPVLRDAENMTFADIEGTIRELAGKAQDAKLQYEELVGGTFTITNGGVFGSMLSTPILNAPQSAILGMHTIQQRPVAEDGQVVIRPMMYLALSYDHRIIDGRTAVSFLVAMKESLEDPNKLLIQL